MARDAIITAAEIAAGLAGMAGLSFVLGRIFEGRTTVDLDDCHEFAPHPDNPATCAACGERGW